MPDVPEHAFDETELELRILDRAFVQNVLVGGGGRQDGTATLARRSSGLGTRSLARCLGDGPGVGRSMGQDARCSAIARL